MGRQRPTYRKPANPQTHVRVKPGKLSVQKRPTLFAPKKAVSPKKTASPKQVRAEPNKRSIDDESDSMVKIERIRSSRSSRALKMNDKTQIERAEAAHSASVQAVQGMADTATASEQNRVAAEVLTREMDVGPAPAAPLRMATTELHRPAASEPAANVFAPDGKLPDDITEDYAAAKRHARIAAATTFNAGTGTATLDASAGMRIAQGINKTIQERFSRQQSLVQEVRGEADKNGFRSALPHAIPVELNPFDFAFVRRALERCPNDAVQACLTPKLEDIMRSKLTVNRRKHEELMLRTPGDHEFPCARKNECMGRRIMCVGGGETLMAFFSEEEWISYQSELQKWRDGKAKKPSPPNSNTRCLLCLRVDAATHVMQCRIRGVQFRVHEYDPNKKNNRLPFDASAYCNLVNTRGEYRLQDCIGQSTEGYRGIVAPMVRPDLVCFERCEDKVTNTVRFKQLLPYPDDEPTDESESDGMVDEKPADF